ncbi:MAG: DUF1566 domain-containing protein [Prevotella sp.]|jgi:uncharacterized protein (TIGR02145 family)|nr:DUF1566 domain-containing protein [Prevotella sp.]
MKKPMKQLIINDLIWDDKDVNFKSKSLLDWELFNWEAAIASPKEDGWRLPTIDELKALAALGSTWDSGNPGRWFGPDSELLSESKESIFLRAHGYKDPDDGVLYNAGYNGYYWSSTPYTGSFAYALNFYGGGATPAFIYDRRYGFSVRLVRDIP